ncbi:MAG TPA: DinB family protein, partial [Cytophagales bacterium]
MEKVFTRQYELLQGARGVLLDYCETLAPADFTRELPGFGRGSIRNLLVHTVNTYRYWLELFARNQPVAFAEPAAVREAAEARRLFAQADEAVRGFIRCFRAGYDAPLTG